MTVRPRAVSHLRAFSLAFAAVLACTPALACDNLQPPRALPATPPGQWSLVTQNLWRFRDSRRDGPADKPLHDGQVQARTRALARYVRDRLALPHVLAVQEVENEPLLQSLADAIAAISAARYRVHLAEGADPSGMDVGVLVRDPVQVEALEQLFVEQRYRGAPLFSRPPLRLEMSRPVSLSLLVVHLRSARGLDDPSRTDWVRGKRAAQAQHLRSWMQDEHGPVVLVGDFNSAPGERLFGEPLAIIDDAWPVSAWARLPAGERYSYRHRCAPQAIDHVLMDARLAGSVASVAVSRGNAGRFDALYASGGLDPVSDHDALAVFFAIPAAAQLLPDSGEKKRGGE